MCTRLGKKLRIIYMLGGAGSGKKFESESNENRLTTTTPRSASLCYTRKRERNQCIDWIQNFRDGRFLQLILRIGSRIEILDTHCLPAHCSGPWRDKRNRLCLDSQYSPGFLLRCFYRRQHRQQSQILNLVQHNFLFDLSSMKI